MMPTFRVISIGTLSSHPLWEEGADVRTGHTTTVLIEAGAKNIVVDPGLPAQALAARFFERSPVRPADVTDVFLTSFDIENRRGLQLFEAATWHLHEPERSAARATLEIHRKRAADAGDAELVALYDADLALLDRTHDAPDSLAPAVDLFPLPGPTPGTCGVLLPLPSRTVVIAGDAVATIEHLREGKVLPTCIDIETAMESFQEVLEIADIVIPGRDNIVLNPVRSSGGQGSMAF
jgi:glyoxylase-like metal-dependent hydrolase (beta-lactamase superfamily II)